MASSGVSWALRVGRLTEPPVAVFQTDFDGIKWRKLGAESRPSD